MTGDAKHVSDQADRATSGLLGSSAEVEELRNSMRKEFNDILLPKMRALEEINAENIKKLEEMQGSNPVSATHGFKDISASIEVLRGELHKFQNEFDAKLDRINKFVQNNSMVIEDLDQRSRANTLLISGLKENEEEDCLKVVGALMRDQLDLNVPDQERVILDRVYRLGPKRSAAAVVEKGPRPLLVKFHTHQDANYVYMAKKKLKGKKIYIAESLTPTRLALLRRAKEAAGANKAWTMGGKVYAVIQGKKKLINSISDLV